ncbi:cysteine hydrolase family protein [Carnobacterium gallinarum]|uniref:cysteine hydrolase family protein n=1 Tax=Carnobacterium gallinarum TaxID=2749 RepID=UPI00055466AF|nr:cysteine hydrolase family protein [Carnobacterium gallinarum]
MELEDVLVIIDLQNGLQTEEKHLHKIENVLMGVNQRIAAYRQVEKPIIFVQHSDEELVPHTKPWELMPELDKKETDYYIGKTYPNAFFKTDLQELLTKLAVKNIEICGAQTEFCVDTTIRFAHGLGYSLSMVKGLNTTLDTNLIKAETIIAHHESIWDRRFLTFI